MYVSSCFFFGRKNSRVASRLVDGPVSVRRIYTDLVDLGPSLFNVVRKGRNFLDERLGLMWNESITAIILKERWDKCQV